MLRYDDKFVTSVMLLISARIFEIYVKTKGFRFMKKGGVVRGGGADRGRH